MDELTAFDVEQYTKGRLSAGDPETQRALDAALARVRNHCYWHVSPVKADTVTVRVEPNRYGSSGYGWSGCGVGVGDYEIALPTLKLVSIDSITEDGQPVDLDSITVRRNTLTKTSGCWRGDVVIAFTHGYTADEAQDFRDVVLKIIDRESANVGDGGSGALVYKQVDDIQARWAGGTFEELYGDVLRPYRRVCWAA
ncbi:hypothetical protein BayCH28_22270 [Mycolicibacterium sp. CH28]|uniref:hypothetical protein n=1 Tax=Mycolicibacterium sp. CH28 TaxID=2512237 RepID=UPI001080ACB6|nr:hypothetical protein [Mycolicibacterium sp. CH28]TGD85130.1 hypothetical protein BayCH28_22270 [Mycolicibacterium sp. CH28]